MSWQFPVAKNNRRWAGFVEFTLNRYKGEIERIWKRISDVPQSYPGVGGALNGFDVPGTGGSGQQQGWRIGVVQGDYAVTPGSSGVAVTWQYGIGAQGSETGDGNNRVGYLRNVNGRWSFRDQDKVKATWNGTAWELEPFTSCSFLIGKTDGIASKGSRSKVNVYLFDGTSHVGDGGNQIDAWFLCGSVRVDKWVHCSFDPVSREWYAVAAECG